MGWAQRLQPSSRGGSPTSKKSGSPFSRGGSPIAAAWGGNRQLVVSAISCCSWRTVLPLTLGLVLLALRLTTTLQDAFGLITTPEHEMLSPPGPMPFHGGTHDGDEDVFTFAKRTRDFQLLHLARLEQEVARSGNCSVALTRELYQAALASFFSNDGVFDPVAAVGMATKNPAARFVAHAFSMLSHATHEIVPCTPDTTMPPPPGERRYLIAANMHSNANVMPNFLLQLLDVLLSVPEGQAYVSMYESGSSDATPRWLHMLQLLLHPIGVANNITIGGKLVRTPHQDRIEYLAGARNAVISPFFPSTPSDCKGRRDTAACFDPDRIVFLNDIFFCPDDVKRLMHHDTHLTCGMDFSRFGDMGRRPDSVPHNRRRLAPYTRADAAPLRAYEPQPRSLGLVVAGAADSTLHRTTTSLRGAGGSAGAGAARQGSGKWTAELLHELKSVGRLGVAMRALLTAAVEPKMAYHEIIKHEEQPDYGVSDLVFHDVWVTRDRFGSRFLWNRPYGFEPETAASLARGLPFPVQCCWNGAVSISPEPFRRGLRFRAHMAGECGASECSLFCDDLHRMGLHHITLDPAVRVGYGFAHKWIMHDPGFNYSNATGIHITPWSEVAASPSIDWSVPADRMFDYSRVVCCSKALRSDFVSWKECHTTNIFRRNHTRAYLDRCSSAIHTGQQGSRYLMHLPAFAPFNVLNRPHWASCPTS